MACDKNARVRWVLLTLKAGNVCQRGELGQAPGRLGAGGAPERLSGSSGGGVQPPGVSLCTDARHPRGLPHPHLYLRARARGRRGAVLALNAAQRRGAELMLHRPGGYVSEPLICNGSLAAGPGADGGVGGQAGGMPSCLFSSIQQGPWSSLQLHAASAGDPSANSAAGRGSSHCQRREKKTAGRRPAVLDEQGCWHG